jgi:DedD protein
VDIRVKERLTGAVILVALIVLVVPELLSGPAIRMRQPTVAPDEPPLRSVTLDLGDEARSAFAARPDGTDLAAPSKSAVTAASVESAAQSSSAAPTQSVAQSAQALPEPQAVEPAQSGRSAPATHAQRSARAEPHDAAHVRPSASAGWSVQVGSFESHERADRFVHRLRAAGFTAFISESLSHGRKWYRVRVGPERDRVAAKAMVVRLHSAGHAGSIVPPS